MMRYNVKIISAECIVTFATKVLPEILEYLLLRR